MFRFASSSRSASNGRTFVVLLVGVVVTAFLAMGMSGTAFAAKAKAKPFVLTLLTSKTEALPADRGVPIVGATVELWSDGDDDGDDDDPALTKIATYTTNSRGVATISSLNTASRDEFAVYAIHIDPSTATPDLDAGGWYAPSNSTFAFKESGEPTCDGAVSADFNDEGDVCGLTSFAASQLNPSGSAYLSTAASLSGTIGDPDGASTTLAAQVVALRKTVDTDDITKWVAVETENVTGQSSFSFTGLAPGEYVVEADSDHSVAPGWAQAVFNTGSSSADAATAVDLTSGASATQNVAFVRGGEIQGTASLSSGGSGSVRVDAFPVNSQNHVVSVSDAGSAHTVVLAGSAYTLHVVPGTYKVRFTPEGSAADSYYPEWFNNLASSTDAERVVVSSSDDIEQNIDTTLGQGLEISGTVTVPTGSADGTVVDAVGTDGDADEEATVHNGTYELDGLPPSNYVLEFSPPEGESGSFYNGSAGGTTNPDNATVIQQAHGHVTANFDYSSGASLTVHVATAAGKSLSQLFVLAVPSKDGLLDFAGGLSLGDPIPGKPGTYEFDGLTPGQAYAIYFLPTGKTTGTFYPQFWGGEQNSEPTKLYTPVAGANFLDATVASSAALSGTVTSPSKKTLKDVDVDLYRFDGSAWIEVQQTTTSSKGKYAFPLLATGSYTVEFDADGGSPAYAPSFAGGAADADHATSAYVAPGSPAVLNGTLAAGGSIDGTVDLAAIPHATDRDSEYITPVLLTGTPGHFTEAIPDDAHGVYAAPSGKFSVRGLATGYYSLTFGDDDDVLGNPYKDPTLDPTALVVHVVAGQVTTLTGAIDIPLVSSEATATVTGTLDLSMAPDATDVEGQVYFTAPNGDMTEEDLNDDGTFDASLVPGTYTVSASLTDADHPTAEYVTADQTITVVAGEQSISLPVVLANPLVFTADPQLVASNPDPDAAPTAVGTTYTIDPAHLPMTNRAQAEFGYEWLRNGKPIRGANDPSYTLTGADSGQSVQLQVVAFDPTADISDDGDVFDIDPDEATDYAPAISVTPSTELYNTAAPVTSADSSGHVAPGQAIDAKPGAWDGVSHVQYLYKWVDPEESDLVLGYGPTFTPTTSEVGDHILLQVYASKLGYATPAPASSTVELTVDPLAMPTVKTAPKVTHKSAGAGKTTFAVTPGTWSVPGTTPSYQWSVEGHEIAGQTANSFTFDSTDTTDFPDGVASGITVTVGASKTGYLDGSTVAVAQVDSTATLETSDSSVKDPNDNDITPSETTYVAETLTGQSGDIRFADDDSAPTKLSYQWAYLVPSGSQVPTKVSGATKIAYTPVASDIGHLLTLEITASSPTHAPTLLIEQAGLVAANQALEFAPATATPSSTTANVGVPVSYSMNAWSVPGVTNHYQWLACSTDCNLDASFAPIAKATSASFTPTAAQAGDILSITVTGTKSGYADGHAEVADQIAVGNSQTISVASDPALTGGLTSGNATFGTKVTGTSAKVVTKGVSVTNSWLVYNSSTNSWAPGAGSQGGLTYIPVLADFGSSAPQLKLEQTLTKSGFTTEQIDSRSVAIVGSTPKAIVAPSVTIDSSDPSNPQFVAHGGSWPTAGGTGTVSFAWSVNDEVSSDTSSTLPVSAAGADGTVSVRVTYSAPAYATTTVDVLAQVGTAPAPLNSGIPGTVQMGHTLSVPSDPWMLFQYPSGARVNAKVAFQWYAGRVAIPGAKSASWTPTAKYVGQSISVKETSTSPDYATATNQTAGRTLLEGDPIYGNPSVTFIGTNAEPGTVLSVDLGTGFPAGVSHTYQWLVFRDGDFVNIPGATKSRFTIPLADLDTGIEVLVGTTLPGYAPNSQVAGPVSVYPATVLSPIVDPVVAGEVLPGYPAPDPLNPVASVSVGAPVTVTPGSWNVPGVTFSYQWFQDHVIIPGATKATFTPTGDQVGSELTATVTASASGYDSVTVDANGGPQVGLGSAPTAKTKPTVTGSVTVGSVVTATSGIWSIDNLSFSYQWFNAATHVAIDGATTSTYTLTADDSGHGVYVEVTAARDGYHSGTADSAATKTVH